MNIKRGGRNATPFKFVVIPAKACLRCSFSASRRESTLSGLDSGFRQNDKLIARLTDVKFKRLYIK
jgi:hypothetical protein